MVKQKRDMDTGRGWTAQSPAGCNSPHKGLRSFPPPHIHPSQIQNLHNNF